METISKIFGYIKIAIGVGVVLFVINAVFFTKTETNIDLGDVLDRTSLAIRSFEKHLDKEGVKKATDKHMKRLPDIMQQVMNMDPAIHTQPVGIGLLKNATFEGFSDENKNNIKDGSDSRLFKVEIDFDGNRLIASRKGVSTGMGLATGMMAGMLMGSLLGRQRGAGVKSGAFANRKVQSRTNYARSRARSGGRFNGK